MEYGSQMAGSLPGAMFLSYRIGYQKGALCPARVPAGEILFYHSNCNYPMGCVIIGKKKKINSDREKEM